MAIYRLNRSESSWSSWYKKSYNLKTKFKWSQKYQMTKFKTKIKWAH